MKAASVKKITPILVVEKVGPCATFWTERLGFQKTVEVPEGNEIGFVILQKGNVELMYQSYSSVAEDNPATAKEAMKGPTFLYVDVEDLDSLTSAMKGMDVAMPLRTTFYGAREIGFRDPGGHWVIFAQQAAAPQH